MALEQGFGDCTEFSDLMVALCRAKGIPARSRLCIIPRTIDTPLHAIMEAYIPQLGWVTFDPLWTEDTHSEADVLPNRYLTFRIARNDEHLFNFFTPKAYWIFSENKVFDFKTRLEVSNRDESGEWIMKEFTF